MLIARRGANHRARNGDRPSGKSQMSRKSAVPASDEVMTVAHAAHRTCGASGDNSVNAWNMYAAAVAESPYAPPMEKRIQSMG
jgi:hypothetical protein